MRADTEYALKEILDGIVTTAAYNLQNTIDERETKSGIGIDENTHQLATDLERYLQEVENK